MLIILTIAFEKAKEAIEESVDRNMKPIIESLFGEITVLGFLSLFTFCVTKMGFFETLSVRIFGEEEAEELLELFESVHYALFFVMVLFVLLVLNLVSDGIKTEHEWLEMNNECRDPHHIAKCVDRVAQAEQIPIPFLRRVKGFFASTFPSIRRRRNASVADLLHFYSLRREFILERSIEPPFLPAAEKNRVPEDFDFARYLSISLGKTSIHAGRDLAGGSRTHRPSARRPLHHSRAGDAVPSEGSDRLASGGIGTRRRLQGIQPIRDQRHHSRDRSSKRNPQRSSIAMVTRSVIFEVACFVIAER